jgi:DNA-binding GntR family transcriptional regulator
MNSRALGSAGVTPPLERRQLSDEAAAYLRELIISGVLRPGEFVRQEKIAEDIGLSTTPVREGLLVLRGEGFVRSVPRRGFVVAPLRSQDIGDMYVAQALLAGELAAHAAARVDDETLDLLVQADRALQEAAAADDANLVEELNHEFHRLINIAAGSPKLAWVLSVTVRYAPRRFFASIAGWPTASAQDHAAIVAAIVKRDPDAARAAMEHHIRNAGELLVRHFDRMVGDDGETAATIRPAHRGELRSLS